MAFNLASLYEISTSAIDEKIAALRDKMSRSRMNSKGWGASGLSFGGNALSKARAQGQTSYYQAQIDKLEQQKEKAGKFNTYIGQMGENMGQLSGKADELWGKAESMIGDFTGYQEKMTGLADQVADLNPEWDRIRGEYDDLFGEISSGIMPGVLNETPNAGLRDQYESDVAQSFKGKRDSLQRGYAGVGGNMDANAGASREFAMEEALGRGLARNIATREETARTEEAKKFNTNARLSLLGYKTKQGDMLANQAAGLRSSIEATKSGMGAAEKRFNAYSSLAGTYSNAAGQAGAGLASFAQKNKAPVTTRMVGGTRTLHGTGLFRGHS